MEATKIFLIHETQKKDMRFYGLSGPFLSLKGIEWSKCIEKYPGI